MVLPLVRIGILPFFSFCSRVDGPSRWLTVAGCLNEPFKTGQSLPNDGLEACVLGPTQ